MRRPLLLTLALIFLSLGQASAQRFWEMIESGLYSLEEIQQEADSYFENRDKGKGSGYKQYKRWEWQAIKEADENGLLHRNDHSFEKVKQYRKDVQALDLDMPESGNTTGNWEELGPFARNPTSSWNPGVGRIECIALDPNDSQHILVGAPTGGAWTTHDEGGTWTPLMDGFSTMDVTGVAISPHDANLYFIGTNGDGLYRSTDGGASISPTSIASGKVVRILVHPTNPNYVLVASSYGIYRSTDGGQNFSQTKSGSFLDLVYKPNDPFTVYAINGSNFFKSTNGGQSFTQVTAGITNTGKGRIAVTPADPNIVYYMQGNGNSYARLYKSTNSATSFTVVNSSSTDMWEGYGWYGIDMAVSDTDPNLVYLGGMELYRSTNGGSTFTLFAKWSYGSNKIKYIHADIHSLEYAHGHLFTGTDGGISIDENVGASFRDLTSGMGIRQFYDISVSRTDPYAVNTGSQDNGTAVMYGATNPTWYEYLGADGMMNYVDWSNSQNLIGTSQNGGLYRSTNGGQSYSGISKPSGESGAWVTPLVQDPIQSDNFYVGYKEVYKYSFSARTYVKLSSFNDGTKCNLLEVAQTDNKLMFVAKGSKLYKSTNGGTTFTQLSGTSGTINDITIHPADPNKVAVVTSSRVYVSNNGGSTWTNIWGNLPSLSAYCVVFKNDASNGIYVGMFSGIYYKDDNLSNWVPFMDNLPNVRIEELEINYVNNKIYAGTYGRGLWWSDCYGAQEIERDIALADLHFTGEVCDNMVTPVIEVKSKGVETLTDFKVKLYLNGVLKSTQTVSTSMDKGDTKTFTLQQLAVSAGQTLKVLIEKPNGDTDQVTGDSEMEINLLGKEVPIADMSLVSFSSDANNASNATFDNDPNTIWHNNWQAGAPMPHELVYDLGKSYNVSGVSMMNRQNNSNGYLKDVEFYISEDGQNWGTAEAVVFESSVAFQDKILSGKLGRYVKMKILSNQYGNSTASFAEIRFSGCEQNDILRASITSPTDGANFDEGTDVKVTADVTATLGETLTKVEFMVDGNVVGTVTNAPWEFTLQNLSVGSHKLTVVAYETGGNNVTSNEISIQINEVFDYDVAVSNLAISTPAQCGNTIDFSFDLENLGVQDLNNYALEIYLNGSLQSTQNKTLSLASGASTSVNISGITVAQNGANDLKVVVKMPNGNADEQSADNEATKNFSISLGEAHQFVIATRSENPSLAFEVLDNGNVVVDKGDATKSTSGANTVYDFCLVDGCYDLKVTDAFQAGGCSEPAWNASTTYLGDSGLGAGKGEVVSHNGKKWRAQWWTQNHEPGTNNVWLEIGDCNVTYDSDTYQLLDKDAKQLAQSDVAGFTSPKTEAFCTGSQTSTVTADFSANQTSVFSCSDVTFTANTSGTVTSYAWDFGADATPATATGVGPHVVSYATTGAKTVSLTVNGNVTETKSSYVTVSQDANRQPALTVAYDVTEICTGGDVKATVSNLAFEGQNPQFEWKVNNQVVATNANQNYTYNGLNDGDQLSVTLVSDEECVVNQTASTSNQAIKVNGSVTPTISIVADNSTICSGDVVNFTATSNGGTIDWQLNGQSVGTGSTYQSSSLQDGDKVSAVLTSNSSCASQSTATSNVETISVNASVTPTISIVADNSTICSGDVVNFTATSNGGTIDWQVNGQSVGTGSTYQSSSLQDGDKVSAVLTSNSSCASQSTATSNVETISVNASVTPTISIVADNSTICSGDVVNFTATSNGGTIDWQLNGQSVGTGSTYQSSSLQDGDKVSAVLTSDATCPSQATATSNVEAISVNASVTPTISIVADNSTICSGDVVNFTATSNGGTIDWQLNGQSVGTGSTYQSSSLQDGDKVSAVLTSNSTCASQSTATSNVETIVVNASVTPSISIMADNSTICSGDVVNFTATANGGTIDWKLNGQSVGTGSTYQSSSLQDGDKVSAVLTSNSTCASQSTATSNVETISVNAEVTPSIDITADNTTICAGETVSFTANSNGGTIDWLVNDQYVASGSTYQSSSLQDGDKVNAVLNSDATCPTQATATSNIEMISVNAVSSPSISIVASKSSICEGESINYVATASSGSIAWKVNGAVAGNGTSYNSSNLVDGDIVMAELTSDEACPAQAVVASNQEQVLANKPLNPSVEVELDNGTFFPACKGTQVDFMAKVYDEGASPSFYWKVDNVVVATGATYSTSSLKDGQQVVCEMIVSESCVVSSKVASPAVQAEVLDANDSQCITYTEEETFVDLRVYPNPVHDILNVEGLEADTEVFLYSAQGVQLYQGKAGQIDMMEMPAGVYLLRVQFGNRVEIKEIIHD